MKEEKKLVYSIPILIYTLLYFLVIVRYFPTIAKLISCIFIIALTLINYLKYGYNKYIPIRTKVKQKGILYIVISIFLYFTIIYTLGLITGYRLSSYSHAFLKILKHTIFPFISMLVLEIYRYISINNYKNKNKLIIETILIIMFDVVINYYRLDGTLVDLFIFLSVIVLPIILKNILLNYITKNIGIRQCLIYVIPLGLYNYFVPIYPDLGNYLTCIVNMTLPALLYIYLSRMITEENEVEQLEDDGKKDKKKIIKKVIKIIIDTIIIFVFTVFIALISNQFPYQLIGIEVSNIAPTVEKGDAILVYKNISFDKYQPGDIITYISGKKIIIDIITKVDKDQYGEYHIYLKKEIKDGKVTEYTEVTKDTMIGKYDNFRIKKVAYPTIKFKEFIKGDVNEKK